MKDGIKTDWILPNDGHTCNTADMTSDDSLSRKTSDRLVTSCNPVLVTSLVTLHHLRGMDQHIRTLHRVHGIRTCTPYRKLCLRAAGKTDTNKCSKY